MAEVEPRARVQVLPDSLINKIAAGEVIERPASVVKELVENSLDAGASRIEVELEGGGRALVRVADDGAGMPREDALCALQRHATSKIACDDDLFAIRSLGFRGEAVPSIAEVSRFELVTGVAGADAGTRVVVDGGVIERVEDGPNPGGTEIRVRRLFFNTPVRLKFLRTPRTEVARVQDVLQRMALSHPDVAFRLTVDGRKTLDLPVAADLRTRVGAALGGSVAKQLLAVQARDGELDIEGLVSRPALHRSSSDGLHLFVNGRFVKDRTFIGALRGAYQDLLPRGRYPVVVLFLDLEPSLVDVNVHPAKVEVRFQDSGRIWRFLQRSVVRALARGGEGADVSPSEPAPQLSLTPAPRRPTPQGAVGWRRIRDEALRKAPPPPQRAADRPAEPAKSAEPAASPPPPPVGPADTVFTRLRLMGDLAERWLVCADGSHLVLVDRSVLRRRVMLRELLAGRVSPRRLLVPQLVEAGAADVRRLDTAAERLAPLGVELRALGEDTVTVQAAPPSLAPGRVADLVADWIGALRAGADDRELARLLALHSAAGDPAPLDARLLERAAEEPLPDGREALVVSFTPGEVERWFRGARP